MPANVLAKFSPILRKKDRNEKGGWKGERRRGRGGGGRWKVRGIGECRGAGGGGWVLAVSRGVRKEEGRGGERVGGEGGEGRGQGGGAKKRGRGRGSLNYW